MALRRKDSEVWVFVTIYFLFRFFDPGHIIPQHFPGFKGHAPGGSAFTLLLHGSGKTRNIKGKGGRIPSLERRSVI